MLRCCGRCFMGGRNDSFGFYACCCCCLSLCLSWAFNLEGNGTYSSAQSCSCCCLKAGRNGDYRSGKCHLKHGFELISSLFVGSYPRHRTPASRLRSSYVLNLLTLLISSNFAFHPLWCFQKHRVDVLQLNSCVIGHCRWGQRLHYQCCFSCYCCVALQTNKDFLLKRRTLREPIWCF